MCILLIYIQLIYTTNIYIYIYIYIYLIYIFKKKIKNKKKIVYNVFVGCCDLLKKTLKKGDGYNVQIYK